MAPSRLAVLVVVAVAAAAVGACGRDAKDEPLTQIRVIDSSFTQSWDPTEDTGTVYRVEVLSPLGADTIRNVIPPSPISVGDSVVIGLVQVSEDSSTPQRQIFRLRLGAHRVDTSPLPEDVWASFQDVLVSPNGRYIAYVGEDTMPSNPGTYGVVRDLTNNEVVVKGPGGGGCDCDDDLNHTRWFAPDSFEIAVAHTSTRSGWERIAGKASVRRFRVDTLVDEPDWH
ncbi:MAG: hypothetical protein ABR585_03095 [Gemmatimonadaceae bacterium]